MMRRNQPAKLSHTTRRVAADLLANYCLLVRINAPQVKPQHKWLNNEHREHFQGIHSRQLRARALCTAERCRGSEVFPKRVSKRWLLVNVRTWIKMKAELEKLRAEIVTLRARLDKQPLGALSGFLPKCYLDWNVRPCPKGVELSGEEADLFWRTVGKEALIWESNPYNTQPLTELGQAGVIARIAERDKKSIRRSTGG